MDKTKLKWYFNRLRQMNVAEIGWRISQKSIEKTEKAKLQGKPLDGLIYNEVQAFRDLPFNEYKPFFKGYTNKESVDIEDLNGPIQSFKHINWHDAIDTDRVWPKTFSPSLEYKQQDEYGDARKNWEINRHFNLQNLAYKYTKNNDLESYYKLDFYVNDWISENPFLQGISYTSVMEVAIRGFSWFVAYDLLFQKIQTETRLLKQLKTSILNMAYYVANHYSRYSSANNHLLVELVFLGIIGKAFDKKEWIKLSMDILPIEMDRQNYSDGVNKEMSIHYQTFVMEAIALYIAYLGDLPKYKKEIKTLNKHLTKMAGFVSHLMDMNNHIPELGDNDEGKLLDLLDSEMNHYEYVLHLVSGICHYKYIDNNNYHENVLMLYNNLEFYSIIDKAMYNSKASKCYKLGGYTILTNSISDSKETKIIVDHGDLGFGAICAHGQADALSFTLTVDGIPILVDPGTYIYHSQIKWRDYFRKTINHNTVEVGNLDQSEMLGPFLWGKRAESKCISFVSDDIIDRISCQHLGYSPIIHDRAIELNKSHDIIEVVDRLHGEISKTSCINSFILDDKVIVIRESDQRIKVIGMNFDTKEQVQQDEQVEIYFECEDSMSWLIEDGWLSKKYGNKVKTKVLRLKYSISEESEIKVIITVNRKRQ